MKEARGNLWDQNADAICITTNGHVKKGGQATMGAGCALEAFSKYGTPLAVTLGKLIRVGGNHVYWLGRKDPFLFSFPVKHHWRENADLALIERSAHELVDLVSEHPWSEWTHIVLPRPGCGNGHLSWEQVKPVLAPILDDRFTAITF